jgi:GABA(A) receptor-associated protein
MSCCKFITQFKNQPIEKRIEMSSNILNKYHNRCPIIVGKKDGSDIKEIEKKKYICPRDINLAQFIYVIRKKVSIKPEQSIFLFIDNKILPSSELMGSIYNEYKEKDGFLYVTYCVENTFGAEGIQAEVEGIQAECDIDL